MHLMKQVKSLGICYVSRKKITSIHKMDTKSKPVLFAKMFMGLVNKVEVLRVYYLFWNRCASTSDWWPWSPVAFM